MTHYVELAAGAAVNVTAALTAAGESSGATVRLELAHGAATSGPVIRIERRPATALTTRLGIGRPLRPGDAVTWPWPDATDAIIAEADRGTLLVVTPTS